MKRYYFMRKITSVLTAVLIAASCSVPLSADANDEMTESSSNFVYGTMDIPYAEFYAAELNNTVPVDAVSSATSSKWSMNQTGSVSEEGTWTAGGLAAGTFNDGAGKILGITYPVEIAETDLETLSENYHFTKMEQKPVAYKPVTVTDGVVSFGKIEDTDGAEELSGEVAFTNISKYGDYQAQVSGYPQNADIYGIILKTSEGADYGLRTLENIFRNGQFAWSAGCKLTESHGNTLAPEHYKTSQGQTISEITYITLNGYATLSGQDIYLALKVADSVSVEDSTSGTGSTTFDTSIFPEDYQAEGSVADGFTVSGNTINYENAQPGSYTLTVADSAGIYSEVAGTFTLTTEEIPVKYVDGKLIAADGYTEEDAANFIKNISSVTVGETVYKSGKHGVTVIDASTGEIKLDAVSGETKVFAEDGTYHLTVSATGYQKPYEFDFNTDVQATSESASESESESSSSKSNNNSSSSSSRSSSSSSSSNSSKSTSSTDSGSPKTADASTAIPITALAVAAGIGIISSIKRKK